MMSDQIKQMMQRAAMVSPQYQAFTCYVQVLDEHDRPKARSYDWSQLVNGTLRWPDYDDREGFYGGQVGDGIVTLVGARDPVPDLLQAADGTWLSVNTAEGRDAMETGLRVRVRRWSGDPPSIETPAP